MPTEGAWAVLLAVLAAVLARLVALHVQRRAEVEPAINGASSGVLIGQQHSLVLWDVAH